MARPEKEDGPTLKVSLKKKVPPVKEPRTQAGALETLWQELQPVFEPKKIHESVAEDFVFLPIDDPDGADFDVSDRSAVAFDAAEPGVVLTEEDEDLEGWLIQNSPSPESIIANWFQTPGAYEAFGGEHPGGLLPAPADPKQTPPTDCLAFYLPFHFYFPQWWGIYLLAEGVQYFAAQISVGTHGVMPWQECWKVARVYLYSHEAYHHIVESFATRLEVTHRTPLYRFGFSQLYRATLKTENCMEEALADAYAYRKAISLLRHDKVKQTAIANALQQLIKSSPPSYHLAINYLRERDWKTEQNEFAERNHRHSLPLLPHQGGRLWNTAPYAFSGFSRVTSRVSYVLRRGSTLANRLPLDSLHRLRPSELIRRLQQHAGIVFVRNGGNHDIYQSRSGHRFPIPRHPRDLSTGTLRKILTQAGLKMSIQEFLQHRKEDVLDLFQ